MSLAMTLAGVAMGVAASPHCALMCSASCGTLTHGCARSAAGFHLGRLLGYMAGGALAAGSMAMLASWTAASPAVRPLWTLVQMSLWLLGLWWLLTGRQPDLLRRGVRAAPIVLHGGLARHPRWRRAGMAGLAWVAWPCAALHAALLLAAMADGPLGGALVMGGFAVASMPALGLAPWLWSRWRLLQQRRQVVPATAGPDAAATLGLRVAGVGLVLSSGWALSHGLWLRVAAWCGVG